MTVLVAVDGEEVPSRSVEVGYDLAQQYDDDLVVMHVMPQEEFEEIRGEGDESDFDYLAPQIRLSPPRERTNPPGSEEEPYSIEDGETDAADIAEDVVAGTLDSWTDVGFQGRVGDPADEIISEAERSDARFLVVGGRKRTPVGKAVFGSVSQSVMLNTEIPVVNVMREK